MPYNEEDCISTDGYSKYECKHTCMTDYMEHICGCDLRGKKSKLTELKIECKH